MSKAMVIYRQDRYRFALYDNTRKLTRQQIQKETGCYALINLWLFSLVNQPKYGVKYWDHQNGGVMLRGNWAYEKYDYPGICIDKDGHLTTGGKSDAVWDYAACAQVEYLRGLSKTSTAYARNGLTYTGLTAAGDVVVLLATNDTPMTGAQATAELLKAGCADILRWDGSWSSQGYLGPGMDIQPSQKRLVRGYLLIYKRDGKDKEDKPVDGITQAIMTKSDCYKAGRTITPQGIMVHSTATPGADAQTIRDAWNRAGAEAAVHYILDNHETLQTLPDTCRGWHCGAGANNTHIAFEICEPAECRLIPCEWVALKRGSTGWAVKRLQMELQARGFDPKGVDGSFGPGCEAALKACQKSLGLTADGSCGPATKAKLAERTGSYLAYNPQDTAAYFAAAWGRAVALCSGLCKRYGFDPEKDILCHSEGYAAGIASNHADVMHWFPEHGRTMDDFRNDVKAAMAGTATPDPLGEAVDKLAGKGILSSPDYWKGGDYSADNVKALIIKMAAAI